MADVVHTHARVQNGRYRNFRINGWVLPLVKEVTDGKRGTYVTVDGRAVFAGQKDEEFYNRIRVTVARKDVTLLTEAQAKADKTVPSEVTDLLKEAREAAKAEKAKTAKPKATKAAKSSKGGKPSKNPKSAPAKAPSAPATETDADEGEAITTDVVDQLEASLNGDRR